MNNRNQSNKTRLSHNLASSVPSRTRGPALGLVLAGVLLMASLPVAGQTPASLQVEAKVEPTTVLAGGDASIIFTLKNAGGLTAGAVKIYTIDIPAGFTVSGVDNVATSSLAATDSGTRSISLLVANDTSPGRYILQFGIQYCSLNGANCDFRSTTQTVIVNVVDLLQVSIKQVQPNAWVRAESGLMMFEVRNPSDSALRDVVLRWTVAGDAILPLGQDNSVIVSRIEPQSSATASIPVVVSADAALGTLPLDATIGYRDASGEQRSVTSRVGLLITGAPVFEVGDLRLNDETLTLTVANVAQTGGTSVIVRALDDAGTIVGTGFLGEMDGGDYATLSLQLERRAEQISRIELAYTDSQGERRTTSTQASASQAPPVVDESGALSTPQLAGVGIAVIVGLLIVISVIRRRRR